MQIISRAEWGADKASLPSAKMTLPATELWIHHTVTGVTGDPAADMRAIEVIGLQRFKQFSYSYCVHPEGVILEGAGLRRGAHTKGRNSKAFGVAWIGNYDQRAPKIQQMEATRWLIWWLQEQGHLRPEIYPTGGHRDLMATACPGANLYRIMDDLRRPWFPPQETGVAPMWDPPLQVVDFLPYWGGSGGWMLFPDGGIGAVGDAPYRKDKNGVPLQPFGQDYWGDRRAARIERLGDGYRVTATTGEHYDYP